MLLTQYNPYPKYCGLRSYAQHETTGARIDSSISRLEQVAKKMKLYSTSGTWPKEIVTGSHIYISSLNPSIDAKFNLYVLKKSSVKKGGYSYVYMATEIVSGMPCAYKIRRKTAPVSSNPIELQPFPSSANFQEPQAHASQNLENSVLQSSDLMEIEVIDCGNKADQEIPFAGEGEEAKSLFFLRREVEKNPELTNLLPLDLKGNPYIPFVELLGVVKWANDTNREDLVLEKGDLTLRNYVKEPKEHKANLESTWIFAKQLLAILKLLEKMNIGFPDFKSKNTIITLANGALKLIDFDSIQQLSSNNDDSPICDEAKVPHTFHYYTRSNSQMLKKAKTKSERCQAFKFQQRTSVAHTLFELLRQFPISFKDEKSQKLHVKKKQNYTEFDLTKTKAFQLMPENLQNMFYALLDEKLPSLDEIELGEAAKKEYEKVYDAICLAHPIGDVLTDF